MCGRYAATKDPATLVKEFDAADNTEGQARPDHNVAPTKNVVTVVERHPRDADGTVLEDEPPQRQLRMMRWGLIPFWAKDKSIGAKMINTRAETAASKPAFRKALKRHRCLVPADGWYEWQRLGKNAKQPFYMTTRDGSSLAFAGIWETWRDPQAGRDVPPLVTCSVLTVDAVGPLTDIHDRMPLVLPRDAWGHWLDPDVDDVAELLKPPPLQLVDELELRPVSNRVNSVRNNGPELIERVDPAQQLDEPALFDAPNSA